MPEILRLYIFADEKESREMNNLQDMGKLIIFAGLTLIVVGMVFMWGGKFANLGRLPGDIYIQKKNFSLFFPLTTSILVSVVLSVVLWLVSRR